VSARPPSLLFVTGNRLGDAVLSSGVLARMVDEHPGARVTVACGALPAPLFVDLPGLERTIVIRRHRRGLHWLDLWAACVAAHWDVVADLRGSFLPWTLLARRRLMSGREHRHEHRVIELARQLRLDPPPEPRLWVSAERAARAARLDDGPPILAVAPAANWGGKQWPAERFAETVRRLTGPKGILPGARLLVAAAAAERSVAEPVLDSVPAARRIDLVGAPDLLDLYAILGRCALFIGNDSGLMHLAAAAGAPTLGLFGPSPDWRYGPWGARAAVVRTPEPYRPHETGYPGYDWHANPTLMGNLAVETVAAAAENLWRRVGAPRASAISGGNGAGR